MPSVEITVHGDAEEFHPPQRATVALTVAFDGSARADVLERTARAADLMSEAVTAQHDPRHGPVTWYSRGHASSWTQHPWTKDGAVLPPVFHSAVEFSVKFSDFDELARFVENLAGQDGVTIGQISWTLTGISHDAVTARVRAEAVRSARAKAQAYADSLDLGLVTPIAIADTGMLSPSAPVRGVMAYAASSRGLGVAGGEEAIPRIVPEDLRIAASVDAVFAAPRGPDGSGG